MSVIETENYELSVNMAGPEDSSRLAIIHPGFLETHEYPHMRAYVELFASLGCLAVAYNAPGIWGSRIRESCKNKDREYSMYRQVDAGIELCRKFIEARPDIKITGVGHSGGGRPPVHEAAVFKDNFDSLILDRVAYTWLRPSNIKDRKFEWQKAGVKKFKKPHPNGADEVEFEVPYDYSYRAADYDIHYLLQHLDVEKLQIAGFFDETVPIHEALSDYRNLAKEPKELAIVCSDHYYLSPFNILRNFYATAKCLPKFSRVKPVSKYSNQRAINSNMKIVKRWVQKKGLVPE